MNLLILCLQVDPNNALEKFKRLKLYKYDFKPEFVEVNGGVKSDMGIKIKIILVEIYKKKKL